MQIRAKTEPDTTPPRPALVLEYTRPLSSVQTSLRPWPGPPDRKLINECKRGNVVDKFNKIVHAQLVSPGVNTFWWASVPLPDMQEIRNFSPRLKMVKTCKVLQRNWYALLIKMFFYLHCILAMFYNTSSFITSCCVRDSLNKNHQ